MNQGPECIRAGQCPLCLSPVPLPAEPRSTGDVVAVLARHFSHVCVAIATPLPRPETLTTRR